MALVVASYPARLMPILRILNTVPVFGWLALLLTHPQTRRAPSLNATLFRVAPIALAIAEALSFPSVLMFLSETLPWFMVFLTALLVPSRMAVPHATAIVRPLGTKKISPPEPGLHDYAVLPTRPFEVELVTRTSLTCRLSVSFNALARARVPLPPSARVFGPTPIAQPMPGVADLPHAFRPSISPGAPTLSPQDRLARLPLLMSTRVPPAHLRHFLRVPNVLMCALQMTRRFLEAAVRPNVVAFGDTANAIALPLPLPVDMLSNAAAPVPGSIVSMELGMNTAPLGNALSTAIDRVPLGRLRMANS